MPIDINILNNVKVLQSVGNSDFFARIVNLYLTSTHKNLAELKDAFKTDNLEKLARAAHSIKSSSANLGAITLSDYCRELEHNCRNNLRDEISEIIGSIEKEFLRVCAYLTNLPEIQSGIQHTNS